MLSPAALSAPTISSSRPRMRFTMAHSRSNSSPSNFSGSRSCRSPAMIRSATTLSRCSLRSVANPTKAPPARLRSMAGIMPATAPRARSARTSRTSSAPRDTTSTRLFGSRLPAARQCSAGFSGAMTACTLPSSFNVEGILVTSPTIGAPPVSNSPTLVTTPGPPFIRDWIMNERRSAGWAASSSSCSLTDLSSVSNSSTVLRCFARTSGRT